MRFTGGLNVLTGETGAGKSILIGALGLLLGDRTDTSIVRAGTEETVVSGVIGVGGSPEAAAWLATRGIEPEEGAVILRRVLKATGRGASFIQSTPVTRTDLAEFSSLLFDVHGQHEHQSLLDLEQHRRLLDRHGGTEVLAGRFHELYLSLATLRERLSKLVSDERERLRRMDLLSFAVQEIKALALKPGEQDELEKELAILSHHEKLFTLLEQVHEATAGAGGGALGQLRASRHAMEEALSIDPALSKPAHQLEDACYEIEDFAATVRQYRERAEFSPERLDAVQERLAAIRAAERKYGDTIDAVLTYLAASEQELASMENYEEEKRRLEGEIGRTERELVAAGRELSQKRRAAAQVLGPGIEAELRLLGMPKVSFRVAVQPATRTAAAAGAGAGTTAGPGSAAATGGPAAGAPGDGAAVANPWGLDSVEFVISPNLGEPFKRLRSIASGGELSRVMLAIKGVLAASDRMSTLIFDEVDAGIGGEVALSVGERLARLAASKQVLCVTHLATIAARADNHLRIDKAASGGRTVTRVERVAGASRREEIARMLAGDRTGELSLQHAQELLDRLGASTPEAGRANGQGRPEVGPGTAYAMPGDGGRPTAAPGAAVGKDGR
ncbi:MAG: DNA repair protein RecN [Spirochaetes bacterium]|nr:DNA repair protein RecN [Spirochaetota bacterium]